MSSSVTPAVQLQHPDRFFIDGQWTSPSSDAVFQVIDSSTEECALTVAEAQSADVAQAVGAAHRAFVQGPWPRMTHAERAGYLRALADGLRRRGAEIAEILPRETGILHSQAFGAVEDGATAFDYYASLADTFPFEEEAPPTKGGELGLLIREPVGVVGAIISWNAPMHFIGYKIGPALLAGCTVILKPSPDAPAESYILAELAEEVGLPAGVLNVLTADRDASELIVRDPRVDKITFTGSTAAGRKVGAICGERVARCTLELGGKSAAVVLDDVDLDLVAQTMASAGCFLASQVCSALTRVVVPRYRHAELVDALASAFSGVTVGDPFDPATQMGPLVSSRQRERVLDFIRRGRDEGATLATGGGVPEHLERGWYVEPTVFGNVDNGSSIGSQEIFGPVLTVIPAADEQDAVRVANDSIYGLNATVFTDDVERARAVAGDLRAGTVGHNAFRSDLGIAFGGFKQSGIGREGGIDGLRPFLETKAIILEERIKPYL